MSSGQKACFEDEEAWDALKVKMDLKNTTWTCYSRQAAAAKTGFTVHGMTGAVLEEFVAATMHVQEVVAKAQRIKSLKEELQRLEGVK